MSKVTDIERSIEGLAIEMRKMWNEDPDGVEAYKLLYSAIHLAVAATLHQNPTRDSDVAEIMRRFGRHYNSSAERMAEDLEINPYVMGETKARKLFPNVRRLNREDFFRIVQTGLRYDKEHMTHEEIVEISEIAFGKDWKVVFKEKEDEDLAR